MIKLSLLTNTPYSQSFHYNHGMLQCRKEPMPPINYYIKYITLLSHCCRPVQDW
jgi:hypothetical protein